MSTFKYLSVVIAVLAAAFFLSEPQTGLAMNSYADVMPAVISALPMFSPKTWADEWYQVAHKKFASVDSF